MNRIGFVLLLAALLTCRASAQNLPMHPLEYAPAVVDNPLKGLVPYAGDWRDRFPHSMEFSYLPLSALVIGHAKYDWTPMENLLDGIAARGHQAVFRIYLEYPGKSDGIPAFLVKEGLKVFRYQNTNTQPFPPTESLTPDYQDLSLRKTLIAFIAALGRKYDGDPRIGFITAGLLGTWGEWHDYPRNELFADKAVQREVLDAYEAAFKTTRILVRYPAGENHAVQTANTARRLGYHDDSFAWSTLETGKKEDSWFFLSLLRVQQEESFVGDAVAVAPMGGRGSVSRLNVIFVGSPQRTFYVREHFTS